MIIRIHGKRAALVVAVGSLAAMWLAQRAGEFAGMTLAVDTVVTAAICAGGALAAAHLALATMFAWGESVLLRRAPRSWGLPVPVRRFLIVGAVASVALGTTGPALAAEVNPVDVYPGWVAAQPVASASAVPSALPSTEPVPSVHPTPSARPTSARPPASTLAPQSPPAPSSVKADERGTVHVVQRGESLWRIAASALGPHASDGDIARAWPQIYAANKPLIGSDPGLIFAGQRLTIPADLGA
jgi:nucleoid-associated protein YgaU